MALNLGPLNVLLRLQGAEKFKRDAKGSASSLNLFGKSSIAAGAAVTAVGYQVMKATQVFAEFERGMVRVGAVTNSLGTKAFAGLTERAQDLAKTTEFTARQVSDAMGFMGMAGMKTNQIFEATPAVLQLASAGMVDVASAADTVTNIMAGYGLKTEDLNKANNVLVATFTNSNTSLQQLGQSFKYVGPVAKSAGVEFKEAAAVIGLMGNAGLQADMAGTALRGTILKLLDPTAKGAKIMRQYGINVKDSNGKLKPMIEIFKQLEPIAEDSAKMTALFGVRAGPGMQAALTQGTGALERLINKIDGAGNIAERIAKAQMETLDGKIKIMKSNFEGLQIAIGDALGSKTAKLVGFLANRFDDLAWSIKKVNKFLSDPTAQAAQSEAEVRRQQNAIRQREIGRMLGTGFYRASYPMGHPLAGMQVSPTMLQAQGATAGMMAGTEPGRLAAITDKQRAILQEELNRLRAEEAKLIKEENIERDKKKKKDDEGDGDGDKKMPKIFDLDAARAAYLREIAQTDFEAAAGGLVDVLAEIGYKGAQAVKASTAALFMPMMVSDVISPLAKASDELAKRQAQAAEEAAKFAHDMKKTGDAITKIGGAVISGQAGATYGAELGSVAGAAIAGALSGGAAAPVGASIGGLLGGLFGDALDELVRALGVLTPIFDFVGDIVSALEQPLIVLRYMISSVADMLLKAFGPMLEATSNIMARSLYGVAILFQALAPVLGLLINVFVTAMNFLTPVLDMITSAGIDLAEKALIPFARVVLTAYNAVVGFVNGITFFLRNIEIGGVKPFKDFGVELDTVSTHVQSYADLMREETEAREESTKSLRDFNEELTNVPIGIKKFRAMQFESTRGVVRGTPFGQSAFGV